MPAPVKSLLFIVLTACIATALMLGFSADPLGRRVQTGKALARQFSGQFPLTFEANAGQADAQVKFLSRGPGHLLSLTATEAVLQVWPEESKLRDHQRRSGDPAVLRMKLAGSNPAPRIEGLELLAGKSNYFIGNDPSKWRANVPHYAKVRYAEVYPGVDLVYHGDQRRLEYDFIVSPGADPTIVAMTFDGAEKLEVDGHGDLIVRTAGQQVVLHKPDMYQELDGARRQISGGYNMSDNRQVGFNVGAYEKGKALVIDPMIVSLGSLGGTSIALDSSGNIYLTGTAASSMSATPGAFQTQRGGGYCYVDYDYSPCGDAFVAKLTSSGNLIYATYLGGSSGDRGNGIAVDPAGNAYVVGNTASANFPAASPIQPASFRGCSASYSRDDSLCTDAFVAKLSKAGDALLYSTFLGGTGRDGGSGIAIDAMGNAYVTGSTNSADFPTVKPMQAALGAGTCGSSRCTDAFVAKVNAEGSQLVYSTYLGGSGSDSGSEIAIDAAGSAYVAGSTNSSDFPTTSGAFARTCASGSACSSTGDAFAVKLNPAGSALVYATYLGGGSYDYGYGVAVDASGNAYLTGPTWSADFPTTPDAFRSRSALNSLTYCDTFVAKLNASGSGILYSTYLGGSNDDFPTSIALDASGNIYVAGWTGSSDFPTLDPAFKPAPGSGGGFLVKFAATGRLLFGTYLSSSAAVAVDAGGNIYVTGPRKIDLTTSPVPTLTSLSPTTKAAGGPGFTLTVTGSNFVGASVVRWGGSDRPTVFVASSLLTATVTASDLASGGTIPVTVFTPPPGGGLTNALTFTITVTPPPTLSSLKPAAAAASGPGFLLTVTGSGFVQGSVVRWNGSDRPTTLQTSTQLLAAISASDVAVAGTAQVTVFNPAPGGGLSNPLAFPIIVFPAVNAGGMVNGATFGAQSVTAGSIGSLFGTNLALSVALAQTAPLPTILAGTTVQLNGIAAPLFYASPTQMNLQIPWQLAGQTQASVVVSVSGVASAPQTVNLSAYGPGIFTVSQTGSGQGAVLIAGTTAVAAPAGLVSGARPVNRGEYISIYCTGLGPVSNTPASGAKAPDSPLSSTSTLPVVTVGGWPATVGFSGLAPSFVGLYQVNAQVPDTVVPGDAVPVTLSIGGAVSNTVTIAVR
jgi:uncharacterized protein (TIGR03437 family)